MWSRGARALLVVESREPPCYDALRCPGRVAFGICCARRRSFALRDRSRACRRRSNDCRSRSGGSRTPVRAREGGEFQRARILRVLAVGRRWFDRAWSTSVTIDRPQVRRVRGRGLSRVEYAIPARDPQLARARDRRIGAHVASIRADDVSWRYELEARCAFVTRENINRLIGEAGFTGDIGLLSIDLDGNDYWVWEAIDVVSRGSSSSSTTAGGAGRAVAVAYDRDLRARRRHFSHLYFGASIAALARLGTRKGYSLVGPKFCGQQCVLRAR